MKNDERENLSPAARTLSEMYRVAWQQRKRRQEREGVRIAADRSLRIARKTKNNRWK